MNGPFNDSPHVRAIASRPGPAFTEPKTNPDQLNTKPKPQRRTAKPSFSRQSRRREPPRARGGRKAVMNDQQVMTALAKANEYRVQRSTARKAIRGCGSQHESRQRLAALLDDPIPGHLETLRVIELLGWVRSMPSRTADRLVAALGAAPRIRAGALTERQRLLLARLLRGDQSTLRNAEVDQRITRWRNARPRSAA